MLAATPLRAQSPAPSAAIGSIKTLSGSAVVIRSGREIPAALGLSLFQTDSIRTGKDGRLGLTLKDETRLTLGPNTVVHLKRYSYAPSEKQVSLGLRVLRGAASYISGRIAAIAPDSVRIETPRSIIGVRGTHLLISVPE